MVAGEDRLVWTKSLGGDLTTARAYEDVRTVSVEVPRGRKIWYNYIAPRRSLGFWKALHGALPVETVLQKRGTIFASVLSFLL